MRLVILLAALALPALAQQTVTKPGTSAPNAQGVQGVTGGVPLKVTCPDGTCSGTGGGGTASSVTINDPTITTQKLAVDALGKIAINNSAFDITDRVGRALGVVSVTGSVAVTGTFWQATQPISALALPLPAGASTDRTTAAAPFSVRLSDGAAFIDPRSIRALTSADVVSAAQSGTWTVGLSAGTAYAGRVRQTDGTLDLSLINSAPASDTGQVAVPVRVISQLGAGGGGGTASSVAINDGTATTQKASVSAAGALKVDGSAVTQPISAGSLPLPSGAAQEHATAASPAAVELSTGAAFYDARDQGVAAATAGAWPTKVTDGTTVTAVDPTFAAMRATLRPMEALGFYSVFVRVGSYTTTTANSIVYSMRWHDATRKALILKIQLGVMVSGTVTAGAIERQVVVVRGFTASDTGGTAVTLSGNNAKLRTSFPTSLVTDMRFGPANLVAGTGTADATPITGMAGIATAVGSGAIGSGQLATVWDATDGGTDHPIVLSADEGVRVKFGAAADAASTRETIVRLYWAEVNSY